MLGAIVGDIIGSLYEFNSTKRYDFELFARGSSFTDDTVLSVATAEWLLDGGDYAALLKGYTRRYPDRGYGGNYYGWALGDDWRPYNSFGNGSAMRVGPVGWACRTLEETLAKAEESAAVTHNHPEGIKGARAVATAIFLARREASKGEIRDYLVKSFDYDLARPYEEIQIGHDFDVTCQGSVPEALIAFLDSCGFVDAVRKAVALGGDSDTQACIAGAVAEAFYGGVPAELAERALGYLDDHLHGVTRRFVIAYC
jgi:ADP-ribosylglycohydrolase